MDQRWILKHLISSVCKFASSATFTMYLYTYVSIYIWLINLTAPNWDKYDDDEMHSLRLVHGFCEWIYCGMNGMIHDR